MEGFHSGHGKVVATLLFHRSHLLAQGFRRIERGYFPIAALQKVMGEAAAETLVQLWLETETANARGSAYILLAASKDSIQFLTVSGCDILHVRNVFQPPLYFQGRSAGIQQVFQHFTLVQVFQREQVLVADDCFSVRIHQTERQAAELGALSPVGASAKACLTDVALSAITYTKRAMYKDFQRRLRTGLMDIAYLLQ